MVKKEHSSPSVSPCFGCQVSSLSETPYYKTLKNLAKSANQWLVLKKTLTHDEGIKTLEIFTERNQVLAATFRFKLSSGTLQFRSQIPAEQLQPSLAERKFDILVTNGPEKLETFRKIFLRKFGRELFEPFTGKVVRVTVSTYITDNDKVIRRKKRCVLSHLLQIF